MAGPTVAIYDKQRAALAALNDYLGGTSPGLPRNADGELIANTAYRAGLKNKMDALAQTLGFNPAVLDADILRREAHNREDDDPRLAVMYDAMADVYKYLKVDEKLSADEKLANARAIETALPQAAAKVARNAAVMLERNNPSIIPRAANYLAAGARSLAAIPMVIGKTLVAALPFRNPHSAVKSVADSLFHLPFGDRYATGTARVVVGAALIVRSLFTLLRAPFQPAKVASIIEDRLAAVMPRSWAKNVGRVMAGIGFAGGWMAIAFLTGGLGSALGLWNAPAFMANMVSGIQGLFVNPLNALQGMWSGIQAAASGIGTGFQAAWAGIKAAFNFAIINNAPATAFIAAVTVAASVFVAKVKQVTGIGSKTAPKEMKDVNVFGGGPSAEVKQVQEQKLQQQQQTKVANDPKAAMKDKVGTRAARGSGVSPSTHK